MPISDTHKEDAPTEPVRDAGERDKERERPAKLKGAATKTAKDLSHVPCKFFKVGSCTAGSSCPFSHTILEPGQQKEVCAWFVKGNCKFGHKCALAHILPGQSMAMDRKNKKAAQAAASAVNSTSSGKDGRAGRSQRSVGHGHQMSGPGSRNALLPGSTAPTRPHSSSRAPIPMPLKATLSPSAPAPPVHATDFASYGLPDESNRLPSAPAQGKPLSVQCMTDAATPESDSTKHGEREGSPSLAPLTMSGPARHPGLPTGKSSEAIGFGPIGSPPRASPAVRPPPLSSLSSGSTPPVSLLSTSPFSAPGPQATFSLSEQRAQSDFRSRSGLSASLGAMMSWSPDSRHENGREMTSRLQDNIVVEDGDLEEFIPGSLSELLTPEEKSRRFSRTNSSRPPQPLERDSNIPHPTGETNHRHSRSVPAPSLLQDIRSIWTENGTIVNPDSTLTGTSVASGGLGNGTPSSFQSTSGFGGRSEDILHPSNASAAFLPGLHHFINTKSAQRSNLTSGVTALYAHASNLSTSHHPSSGLSAMNGLAQSPSRPGAFTTSIGYDAASSDAYLGRTQYPSARPIVGNSESDDRHNAFSPSTRALQAHAPGQSLPQGLAAGYSRIHALPPPPAIPSPSTSAAFSPGRSVGFAASPLKSSSNMSSSSLDWHSSSPPAGFTVDSLQGQHASPTNGTLVTGGSLGGLDAMFSRLSYSAAASKGSVNQMPASNSRNTNGRPLPNPQGPLSPLSGPVLTGDDDDLFSMDG
ncbi:hypothetical protein BDY19DRAFT_1097653 [Irpex rosettiformis]|uniref:Uncharacterized protein n=1 Tax=Irpex rosettiformis TaxID=378272 RepID=A0ACB8TN60_9APHY|nr:hypothetical protein BDY19DRAFT_1097653 [Irpex rosettiformis]